MKFGRGVWLAAVLLLLGCRVSSSREGRSPESLGSIPDDVPLPAKFVLDPGQGESRLEEKGGVRTMVLHLRGPFSAGEVVAFFRDHFRLARWKPDPDASANEGGLVFRKGGETVEVRVEDRGRNSSGVTILLNGGGEDGEHP